jgi:hypothetical protein
MALLAPETDMTRALLFAVMAAVIGGGAFIPLAASAAPTSPVGEARLVTPESFPRAETDLHFSTVVKDGGLGKFGHQRAPAGVDKQRVVRVDRDTLSSTAVFDLDAGPVTITLPDAGKRFMSMQMIDEEGYTPEVVYGPGSHTLTKDEIGARYVMAVVRIFVGADDPKDIDAVKALQDAVRVDQPGGPGAFQTPNWDASQQAEVRTGLVVLALTLPDTKGMFGRRGEVDPVRHLIGSATAWGGMPEKDTLVLGVTPDRNDGKTVFRFEAKDVPVDGFWSITVYNERGFFEPNPQHAYALNSVTAKAEPDGSVVVQFGGCAGTVANCLPTPPGWSYLARLYRPRAAILSGEWTFPQPKAVP